MSESVDFQMDDPKVFAHLLRSFTNRAFSKYVTSSEDLQIALAKIGLAASQIPKARATVEVNKIAAWLDTYRRQIIWDERTMEAALAEILEKKIRGKLPKADILKLATSSIKDIEIEPGSIRLNLSEEAKIKVYNSRPLTSTKNQILSLKTNCFP